MEWLLLEGCPLGSDLERQEVLLAAARHGSLATLRWTVRVLQGELTPAVFQEAAAVQHAQWREKLEWLLQIGCPWDEATPLSAARAGRLDVLQQLLDHGVGPSAVCHTAALALGRTDICLWLEQQGVPLPRDAAAAAAAAKGGQLAALRWLVEKRGFSLVPAADGGALLCAAATSGDVAVLSYVLEPRIGRDDLAEAPAAGALAVAALAAAWRGRFAAVRYLVEQRGAPLSADLAAAVASAELTGEGHGGGGRVGGGGQCGGQCGSPRAHCRAGLLRWLHERGCPFDSRAVVRSLMHGDIAAADAAFAAHPVGAFREAAIVEMARSGCLAAMRWLAAHGAPLRGTVLMAAAAWSGELAKVEWLHSMRCDWDAGVFCEAAASGNTVLLGWLAARYCPLGGDGMAYLVPATYADGPDWVTLRTLRELRCPWGAGTFKRVAQHTVRRPWAMELLLWMAANGCPAETQDVAEAAAALGRQDLVVRVARAKGQLG